MNGGQLIAEFLRTQGVSTLFTLCGGHISPILVHCEQAGIQVVDTRQEATAVFAADAMARLTGGIGVAAVTAGPGVTNSVTAMKNAQLANSPVLLLGGATATLLKGRGALQDIDQLALMKPHVKWQTSVRRIKDLLPSLRKAVGEALRPPRGPVFVECPVDLLYDPKLVRQWYLGKASSGSGPGARVMNWYIRRHLRRLFTGIPHEPSRPVAFPPPARPSDQKIERLVRFLSAARKPVLLLGSLVMVHPSLVEPLQRALEQLGLPVYCSGMARGLLGQAHPLLFRHQRRAALREADLIILAGVPCDFRLDYGRQFSRKAVYVAIHPDRRALYLNRRPTLAIQADPATALISLGEKAPSHPSGWQNWLQELRQRDEEREAEIQRMAAEPTEAINPLALLQAIEDQAAPDSIFVGDGGDFVASASYIVRPRSPYSWLDPGPFGTLGVGAGFALAAALCRPQAEIWLLYGDGSAGYSLIEMDTFQHLGLPVIAVIGNDGSWQQIAREQVELLGAATGTVLRQSDYQLVGQAFGARGIRLDRAECISSTLEEARQAAADGTPVVINALIGHTRFRKGAISM